MDNAITLHEGVDDLNHGLVLLECNSVMLDAQSGNREQNLSARSLVSIVDDDQSFGDSMRRLLRSLDYAVAVFPSGAQFLASPQLADTACLIADIHMPDMTGVELYENLVERGQAIPTILVTAYPDDLVKERMVSRGAECYLQKPLEEADLINCLRSAVARGRARGSAP